MMKFAPLTFGLVAMLSACKSDEAKDSKPEVTELPRTGRVTAVGGPEVVERQDLEDLDIQHAVERELIYDAVVPSDEVQVQVAAGVVELAGTAPHLLARERAARLAESVRGVRSVSTQLRVMPTALADETVQKEVEEELSRDPVASTVNVDVEMSEGVATLRGSANSWSQKEAVTRQAMSVRGVREVKNAMTIDYEEEPPDEAIERTVEKRLHWDTLVDEGLIDVDVADGVVYLSGVVGSAAERRRAGVDAWGAGVEDVNTDDLRVEWWALEEHRKEQEIVPATEEEIAEALRTAFSLDPRIALFEIDIDVDASEVELEGSVDNIHARDAAEHIARHTIGVTAVQNRISIEHDGQLDDDFLRLRLEEALRRNAITEAFAIDARVEEGVAILSGAVDNSAEKAAAQEVASRVVGVREVKNQIRVETPHAFYYDPYVYPYHPYVETWSTYAWSLPTKPDYEIQVDIERELFWSPFVDADEVDVSVARGKAVLEGSVDSLRERESAVENAFEGGAIAVDARRLSVEND